MRISNNKLKEYQDAYKVLNSMKDSLDSMARKLYGNKLNIYEQKLYGTNERTFLTHFPSEQRTIVATYIKAIQIAAEMYY
jgi:hypothetical protein